jgi:hypothetical protein
LRRDKSRRQQPRTELLGHATRVRSRRGRRLGPRFPRSGLTARAWRTQASVRSGDPPPNAFDVGRLLGKNRDSTLRACPESLGHAPSRLIGLVS